MRACRRETFASGSSESKSTSGNTPPSASQRPISDPFCPSGNCLPADLPRSMIKVADCGVTATAPVDCSESIGGTSEPAGRATVKGMSLFPRPSLPLACEFARSAGRPASQSAAPHSSQYRDPSRFCVPHLSQVIIGKTSAGPVRNNLEPAPKDILSRNRKAGQYCRFRVFAPTITRRVGVRAAIRCYNQFLTSIS